MTTPSKNTRPVALWLFACCATLFMAATIGAITRLTGSGLSITEWDPINGIIPPLTAEAWNKAFAGYKAIPQFQVLNSSMTLEEFKGIFFWEWFHRFWVRCLGMVYFVPLLWFLWEKRITRAMAWKMLTIFAAGLLQGFVGWFMVESGLEVRTSVSPYRLALHLGFALFLYVLMLWIGLGLYGLKPTKAATQITKRFGWIAFAFLCVTMIWGAFVAGLHAGEAYNTWPLMDGKALPDAAWTLNPQWINAFENLALVQFIHRWLGPTTMILILAWIARRWKDETGESRLWLKLLGGMAFFQVLLGISTLMMHAEVAIATIHQAGAITLLTLLLINLKRVPVKN